jgi:O-antigen/teichoic acid export membrane protein
MVSSSRRALADPRTVARGALWNLLGRACPSIIVLVVIPYLIDALGPSRWGVFTIALTLVGVVGIFDFGVGRALSRSIAERLADGEEAEAASLVKTGILVLTGLGIVGALVMAAAAGGWVRHGLQIPPSLYREVVTAIYVLCASIPLVILNAGLWGIIAAFQKFRAANLINVPIMVMYYVGPLIVLQFYDSLAGVMLVLVGCRLILTVAYWWLCLRIMPSLRPARPNWRELRPLLRVGGWMTVSNVAWPVLTYMDRFVIASVLSAAATGYYSTPFDLVARFSILSGAISNGAYAAMAGSFRVDPANTVNVFRHSFVAIASILFPVCLIMVGFSHTVLTVWLSPQFAEHAAPVLCWLGFGILATSMDGVVGWLIDGIGRPDVNAKLSMIELVISVPLLVLLLSSFGIEGAAIAWSVRNCCDLVVRLWLAIRLYPPIKTAVPSVLSTIIASIGLLGLPLMVSGEIARLLTIVLAGLLYLAVVLRWSLTRSTRSTLFQRLRRMASSIGLLSASADTP